MLDKLSSSVVLVTLVCSAACRAIEPTILQRQGESHVPADSVKTSLAEEFPDELPTDARPLPDAIGPTAPPPPYVPPKIAGDEVVAVEFRDANLSQVLHFIAERAGINVVLDPEIDRRIDVSFPKVTLDGALQAVLTRNGMRLVEDPPGVYWIEVADGTQLASASFTVQSIKADDVLTNLKALVGRNTKLIVDGPQNLVVVRGTQEDVDVVRDYLSHADRLKRQVLIEARILEVTLNDHFQLGLDATVDGSIDGNALTILQALAPLDQSFSAQFTTPDIDATIRAIDRVTGTDLVASPRVLAMTGTEANIEVVQEVPYIKTTSTTSSSTTGNGTNVVQEVEFKESGIRVKVTPTIQEGGSIHIHIDQTLAEVVDVFQNVPVLDTRKVVTDFLVKDRETAVLGGLMQGRKSQTDKGVPGLQDLPLIGRLFRSDDDTDSKRELLIFLTPRIVDPTEAARLTRTFKSIYSDRIRDTGVRSQAEAQAPNR